MLSSFLATPVEKPVLRTPPCIVVSARTVHANALELVVRVIELELLSLYFALY
jgi:hypothetical protein